MAYIIEPEVSGQLGSRTIIDTSVHPPIIKYLHFVFYGWLGDDIIECFPVFLITERLKIKLDGSSLSGYQIKTCEIESSGEFKMLQPNVILPTFYWMEINGKEKDDFKIFENKLEVSDFAYIILNGFNLKYAVVKKLD